MLTLLATNYKGTLPRQPLVFVKWLSNARGNVCTHVLRSLTHCVVTKNYEPQTLVGHLVGLFWQQRGQRFEPRWSQMVFQYGVFTFPWVFYVYSRFLVQSKNMQDKEIRDHWTCTHICFCCRFVHWFSSFFFLVDTVTLKPLDRTQSVNLVSFKRKFPKPGDCIIITTEY